MPMPKPTLAGEYRAACDHYGLDHVDNYGHDGDDEDEADNDEDVDHDLDDDDHYHLDNAVLSTAM